jgi:hypothetical protein
MIKYSEIIDRGFKRLDFGGDSVFFDEHGYEWFICEKLLQKLDKGKIVANWCPETKTIEVMKVVKGTVFGRISIDNVEQFDRIAAFYNPVAV